MLIFTDLIFASSNILISFGDQPPSGPIKNTKSLKDYINTIVECSYVAPKYFEDESLDFVFLDADHGYDVVKRDILSWFPKVKIGGVIAGHDYYNCNSVIRAVKDTIGGDITTNRLSWIHRKKLKELPQ